jgi:mannose-6-phosphate isomerase-like protein (cupin superfamily)
VERGRFRTGRPRRRSRACEGQGDLFPEFGHSEQALNKRVLEGGAYSINIRIVKPTDPPLLHANSLDIWLVSAGSATAVTGGKLLEMKKRPNNDDAAGSSIMGGVEQPLKAGDVLYIPPGVPHGFKDINGFRAFLIRFDTK